MRKLLLIEDNELNSDMLSRRLERAGYVVLLATDGAAGVETARVEQPHCVLMDLSLPVMSGWDAAKALRADTATADIPIVALTAHAMPGDRDRALEAGCDDYVGKPVDFKRLLQVLDRLCGGGEGK